MFKKICAYSSCDEDYLPKCVVALLSIRKWNPEVDLFIVAEDLSPQALAFLERHEIRLMQVSLKDRFYKAYDYPIECFYLFSGPEIFAGLGYDYSVYVDGDVYCNRGLGLDWSDLVYYGGVSVGNISMLLGGDLSIISKQWKFSEVPGYRIQSGVIYFNNRSLAEIGFLEKIATLYDESIKMGVPRKGDDSLFSLFQLVFQQYKPLILEDDYNYIVHNDCKTKDGVNGWYHSASEKITKCVFFHFTLAAPKPWLLPKDYPCYTTKYFRRKWLQRMLDLLSEDEIKEYFPSHFEMLDAKPLRFYWWGSHNVGDLVTRYFLEHACGFSDPDSLKIEEVEMNCTGGQNQGIFGKIKRALVDSVLRKKSATGQSYCISTGSVMRLCSQEATVYGSGIRSRAQLLNSGKIMFVRGPLTRERLIECGCGCPPIYGDPGLFMSFHYKPRYSLPKKRLAIVPHFTEFSKVGLLYKNEGDVIVVNMGCGDLEYVIECLVSAERVVSSSLHGIVFSHSYGIPVRWIKFSGQVNGDDTKYADYFASIGRAGEEYIQALEFKMLDIQFLHDSIKPYSININLDRVYDEMFFDENGIKRSAAYPLAL